jgi:uncharacterized protein YcbX
VLASVHIHPVKSIGGVDVLEAEVQPWGLRDDRRWLVLNPDATVLTAREQHRMLAVTAAPRENGAITLTGLDSSTFRVEAPIDGQLVPTTLSRLESVRTARSEADDWLSHQLGQPVRLAWLDDPRRRTVSVAHGGQPGDSLNLSDAGPLLLTTRASLLQLNAWVAEAAAERGEESPAPLVMTRFRPSVVVDHTDEPFVEDGWNHVRIGSVRFRLGEQCDRCVLTTIDPHTLAAGKEPLRTLARHRQWDHKTWFGIRIIPATTGTVHVGDTVTVG